MENKEKKSRWMFHFLKCRLRPLLLLLLWGSVTRLGDFLLFGQAFKAGGNNYFTQITDIVRQFL